jgi:peptidoglycan/LPS O-acetylase OafA/YrhL
MQQIDSSISSTSDYRLGRSNHIGELTGTRFVAAFAVVLLHYSVFFQFSPDWLHWLDQAKAAVSLFFVLSGFVLFTSYWKRFSGGVNKSQYLVFAKARIARVYPMYLVGLLLVTPITLYYLFMHAAVMRQEFSSALAPSTLILSWLANLSTLHVYIPIQSYQQLWNAPSWSIGAEFFFYGLFPFIAASIVRYLQRPRQLIQLVIFLFMVEAFVFLVAGYLVLKLPNHQSYWMLDFLAYRQPLVRIWEFVIGCLVGGLYRLFRNPASEASLILRKFQGQSFRNLVLGFSIAGIFFVAAIPKVSGFWGQVLMDLQWFVLYTPFLAVGIFTLACGPTFLSSLLKHPILVVLGEASYSLYIVHWVPCSFFLYALKSGIHFNHMLYALAIPACVALSVFFYHFVELPARQFLTNRKSVFQSSLSQ